MDVATGQMFSSQCDLRFPYELKKLPYCNKTCGGTVAEAFRLSHDISSSLPHSRLRKMRELFFFSSEHGETQIRAFSSSFAKWRFKKAFDRLTVMTTSLCLFLSHSVFLLLCLPLDKNTIDPHIFGCCPFH